MPESADVMNRFSPFLPPYVSQGERGCSSLPPHPLTTIDSALRFKETSLRSTQQRSWNVHSGPSHVGEELLAVCGEFGSSTSGRRCSLRYEVRALNLPQVSNLWEVGAKRLHEGVGPTHGSAPTIY